MSRGFVVVDGHGDKLAAPNLLARLWDDLKLPAMHWDEPIRIAGPNTGKRYESIANHTRTRRIDALLVLTDEDDDCPRERAPEYGQWLREARLPFPAAVVLLHREYETLFLPCVDIMAGRPLQSVRAFPLPGLRPDTEFPGTDYERIRDVKGWLTRNFTSRRTYKETVHQLLLTRLLDFSRLRSSGLPCFGSLERALHFLADHKGERGVVYPVD